MSRRTCSAPLTIALALLMLLSSGVGCYRYVPIKVTEAPKLNNLISVTSLMAYSGYSESVAVEDPEGLLIRVGTPEGVRISFTDGEVLKLDGPIRATIKGASMDVTSSTRTKINVLVDDIDTYEVEVPDIGMSILAGAGVGVVLAAITGIVLVVVLDK